MDCMNYYTSRNVSMIKPLLLGFLSDLILGIIILWILHQCAKESKLKHILITIVIGIIAFIYIPLTNHIWFPSFDIWAYAIDAIIPFAAIGLVYSAFKIKT